MSPKLLPPKARFTLSPCPTEIKQASMNEETPIHQSNTFKPLLSSVPIPLGRSKRHRDALTSASFRIRDTKVGFYLQADVIRYNGNILKPRAEVQRPARMHNKKVDRATARGRADHER